MKSILFLLLLLQTTLFSEEVVPKLYVSGSSALQTAADQVSLSIAVLSQNETAEESLSDNNERMHALIQNLQELGIEKKEYATGQFSIQPIYTPYPKNPPADFKQKIIGYDVTNSITVKTTKLELLPKIIDAATKARADRINRISFNVKDPLMFRQEAVKEATANAMLEASTIAEVTNVSLVRILDIRVDQSAVTPRSYPDMAYMTKAEYAPVIEPGDVDIRANVSITFEIASQK